MGALDMVVDEVGSKFGLSETKSAGLMSGLLSMMNASGGLSGFLEQFKRAGLGEWVSSWLSGNAKPIPPEMLESGLGRNAVESVASRAGLSLSSALPALSFMLPKVIQKLAPGGAIPSRLPADAMSYVTGPTASIAAGARQAAYSAERVAEKSGISRFLWPLLAVLFLGLLGVWLWNRGGSAKNAAFNAEEQVHLAAQKASAALSSLRPGYSSQDLVDALNLYVVNFPTGSAEIPPDSDEFLNKAAVAMRSAPAGTVIEIAGHTDKTGSPGSNQPLSDQRAMAIRDYLIKQGVDPSMLVAKGYGDSKPLATNDTDEGRFRNRRIEFTVVK